MNKFIILIFLIGFSFSQKMSIEYGYIAPHTYDSSKIGYGKENTFIGLTYSFTGYNQKWRTSLNYETWSYLFEDVFGKLKRDFDLYTLSQSIELYSGFVSIYSGLEMNLVSEAKFDASTSNGKIEADIIAAESLLYGALIDFLYEKKHFSLNVGLHYTFNQLVKDRESRTFRVQFGVGYIF